MDLALWWPWYKKIVKEFGFDIEKDRASARIASEIVGKNFISKKEIKNLILNKNVLVFGAGPSLDKDIEKLKDYEKMFVKIAADGASIALENSGIEPDIIVTDLDGINSSSMTEKPLYVVHSHGDNIKLIERVLPRISNVHLTTQAEPLYNVFNYGGFTDGDRAVFLAESYRPRNVVLAGMDFGNKIGKYSNPRDINLKIRKMKYAKRLLEFLAKITKVKLYNFTQGRNEVVGFKRTGVEEIKRLISS